MRVVRNLLALLFLLRSVVGAVGRTIAGQETTALSLAVRLQPEARRLSGTARLTVRTGAADRQRLYFLLNSGLRARAAWEEQAGGARTALRMYRLWLLTVIELSHPLAANEEVRIGIDYGGHPSAVGLGASGLV